MTDEQIILPFTHAADVQGWRAIDDRIMGGCSLSRPEFVEGGGLRFRGVVSLDNGGGFASIRSPEADYPSATAPECGCGRAVMASITNWTAYRPFFDGISYQAAFTPPADEWEELDLPFADFVATHHAAV